MRIERWDEACEHGAYSRPANSARCPAMVKPGRVEAVLKSRSQAPARRSRVGRSRRKRGLWGGEVGHGQIGSSGGNVRQLEVRRRKAQGG